MIGPIQRACCLFLLLASGSVLTASEPASRTLAAFDIGSGTTRMLVADVALCTGDILHVHDSARVRVAYAEDVDQGADEQFSASLQQQADAVMAELIKRAMVFEPERKLAVATQAFRLAANAEIMLEHWSAEHGLEARILSQDEEARLAWKLLAARLGQPPRLIVWDIGAGSQQLVWRDPDSGAWRHVNSDLASVTFRIRAHDLLGRPSSSISPNPLYRAETERLAALVADWIDPDQAGLVAAEIGAGAQVIGIGGVHGISLLNQLGLPPGSYLERSDIAAQLERQLGRSDEDIGGQYADTEVVNLVLVGALMDLFGITRYRAKPIDLTEAVLFEHVAGCGR